VGAGGAISNRAAWPVMGEGTPPTTAGVAFLPCRKVVNDGSLFGARTVDLLKRKAPNYTRQFLVGY
jgi:hypothetical protein